MSHRAPQLELETTGQFRPSHIILGRSLAISDAGLFLGSGTRLARITKGAGEPGLDNDRERLIALLSVAWRRRVTAGELFHLDAALDHARCGDKALANLRLVFADLPLLAPMTPSA